MQSSEYNSFLFWRQPIAELDLCELSELGLMNSSEINVRAEEAELQDDQELAEFSAFHFWRPPLVCVDALIQDLELLL
ncbi:unnamed protein product [Knipowitschia caucasica]